MGRDLIEIYNGQMDKIYESKTGMEPTCARVLTLKGRQVLGRGDGKGGVSLHEYDTTANVMRKVCEFSNTVYRVSCLSCDGEVVLVGDSMGAIKVYAVEGEEAKKVSDSMGSHTTMMSEILWRGDKIYTVAMDNKVSVWSKDKYTRTETAENVHRGGIMGACLVGDKLVTFGSDCLMKVHIV